MLNVGLQRIIERTKDICLGYYAGPLYLKELDPQLIPESLRSELNIEQLQPHWMPEGNIFYKIERRGQMGFLDDLIAQSGKMLFSGAAEANNFLKEHEEYRNKSSNK